MIEINTIIDNGSWAFSPRDINKSLSRANKTALRELAHRVIQDTDQFVPMNTGTLRMSASIVNASRNGIEISYSRPGLDGVSGEEAATLLWEGINPVKGTPIKKWTTEGTGGEWTTRANSAYGDYWKELFTYSWMKAFEN